MGRVSGMFCGVADGAITVDGSPAVTDGGAVLGGPRQAFGGQTTQCMRRGTWVGVAAPLRSCPIGARVSRPTTRAPHCVVKPFHTNHQAVRGMCDRPRQRHAGTAASGAVVAYTRRVSRRTRSSQATVKIAACAVVVAIAALSGCASDAPSAGARQASRNDRTADSVGRGTGMDSRPGGERQRGP